MHGGNHIMYDVIIIGAGPGGIFSAYELMQKNKDLKIFIYAIIIIVCVLVCREFGYSAMLRSS